MEVLKCIIHYVLVISCALVMMYKLAVSVYLITHEDLNVSTFMCGCSFLVLFVSLCIASGSSLTTAEMRELLNSWEPVLRSIDETHGKRVEIFGDILLCIKVITLTGVVHCVAMNAAAFSLVFADLPVCVFPIMTRLGIIPDNLLPIIAWQILFYPLELLTLLPPMIATAFNCHTLILGLGMLGFYAEEVRNMKLTNLETWLQAEHAYRSMRLYNIVYMNWLGTMVVPTLFAGGSAITILLYITFRPSGLPILVYCWFPVVAIVAMFSIAWLCYDAVVIKRKADEAFGTSAVQNSWIPAVVSTW